MTQHEASRTLVKSPPELWAECSEVSSLSRHLGEFGEIKITRLDPETAVAWEGECASGTVRIEPSGWGTRVTLTALMEAEEPAQEVVAEGEPEVVAEEEPEVVAEEEPDVVEEPPPVVVAEEPPPVAVQAARKGLLMRMRALFRPPPPQMPVEAPPPAAAEPGPVEPEPEPVAVVPEPVALEPE
ncbi:MAG TPA: hypothetical protein VH372_15530, partial [Actinospica sp.]|nr:hypothetical protein [Actinospica sp.]